MVPMYQLFSFNLKRLKALKNPTNANDRFFLHMAIVSIWHKRQALENHGDSRWTTLLAGTEKTEIKTLEG